MLDNTFSNPWEEYAAGMKLEQTADDSLARLEAMRRRSQANAKRERKKRAQARKKQDEDLVESACPSASSPSVSSPSVSPKSFGKPVLSIVTPVQRWKLAIRRVIKENRHNRMQTARNRVDSRKRELVRKRAAQTKSANKEKAAERVHVRENELLARPNRHVGVWVQEQLGPSERAAVRGKKIESLKQRKLALAQNWAEEKLLRDKQAHIEMEKAEKLAIGYAINSDE